MKKTEVAKAEPPYRPKLFVNTETAEDEARLNPFYSIIEKYSLTPRSFISRTLNIQETAIASIVKAREELQSKIKELTENVAKYKGLVDKFIKDAKDLFQSVIEEGKFAKPSQDLTALGEEFLPKIFDYTSYLDELGRYETFVSKNGGLFLSHKDIYQNDTGSSVTRFGINVADLDNNQIQGLVTIQQNIGKVAAAESDQKDDAASGKLSSKKGGAGSVKPAKSDKTLKDLSTQKLLHPLEIFVIQEAIKSLMPSSIAEAKPAAAAAAAANDAPAKTDKVVLVDIFERDNSGSIKVENGKIDTHTIVLYLQETADKPQILVIDPSNSDFSKHIPLNITRIFPQGEQNIKIVSPKDQVKIYAAADKDKVGPLPEQYRDCIDIAIKLAFGLNKYGIIDISNITASEAVQEITNQQGGGNTSLFFNPKDAIARIRQASSDGIREQVNKLLMDLDNKTQGISTYFKSWKLRSEADAKISKENLEAFKESHEWNKYKEGVQSLKKLLYGHALYISDKIMENASILSHEDTALHGDVQSND